MKPHKLRPLIFAAVILLAVQIAMPTFLAALDSRTSRAGVLEDNFRLSESASSIELEAFIYHIGRAPGYKIVFIGDSVVEGAMVSSGEATIPAYYKRLAAAEFSDRDIKVYNLSIPGNRPADIYFTYRKLRESCAADLVIMNVNYAFYSDEMLKSAPVARPDLFSAEISAADASALGLTYNAAEKYADKAASVWNLYGRREVLSYYLFGDNLRARLFEPKPAPLSPNPLLDRPWYDNRPYTPEKISHWMAALKVPPFGVVKNTGFDYLRKTLDAIKADGTAAAAFLTPVNSGMTSELNLYREAGGIADNIKTLKEEFARAGVPLFDYTNAVDERLFTDLFHLTAAGNEALAGILFRDTADAVRSGAGR